MEQAKNFVAQHTSRKGHMTDVDEVVNPAVTWETVKPERHEEVVTAVDKEVHQHHYHTTVQPLVHQEVLPTKHTHIPVPVKHLEFKHGNEEETKARLLAEAAQFKNVTRVVDTTHTKTALPVVTGEHVHHHVHETVQPVVYKETIAKEYVHTVVPVHEVHHAHAEHHGLSRMPVRHLESFLGSGGIIDGKGQLRHEEYAGAPRQYDEKLSTTFDKLGLAGSSHTGHHHGVASTSSTSGTTGTTGLASTSPTTAHTGHHVLPNASTTAARGGNNTITPTSTTTTSPTVRSGPLATTTSTTTSTSPAAVIKDGRHSTSGDSAVGMNSPTTGKYASSTRSSGEYNADGTKRHRSIVDRITGRNHA